MPALIGRGWHRLWPVAAPPVAVSCRLRTGSAGLHVVNILFGPDEGCGLTRLHRRGKEQTVGQYRRRRLAEWRLQRDPDDRALVFDSHDPPGATGAVFGLSDPAAVGSDRGQAMRCGQYVMAADEPRDEGARRLLENLAWGPSLADAPLMHHDHQIGERHRFVLTVRDMDKGNAELALQPLQLLAPPAPQERVECRQRLGEQQNLRLRDSGK